MKVQILQKSKWNNIRASLDNNYEYSPNWQEVIDMFEKRINDYYLTPIDNIISKNQLKGEGFSVVTLQCALIEMFAAFETGCIYKHRASRPKPSFEYNNPSGFFKTFLRSEEIFENHFFQVTDNGKIEDVPFSANGFYSEVRCGLMHEGRTKGNWLINAKKNENYSGTESTFIDKEGGNLKIDRTILHALLKQYFNSYILSLKAENAHGDQLRRLFGRKLDHFFDLPRDQVYDWWADR